MKHNNNEYFILAEVCTFAVIHRTVLDIGYIVLYWTYDTSYCTGRMIRRTVLDV